MSFLRCIVDMMFNLSKTVGRVELPIAACSGFHGSMLPSIANRTHSYARGLLAEQRVSQAKPSWGQKYDGHRPPYGSTGAVEDFIIDEIKAQFETNFFGVIRVIQYMLPIMRKQRSGVIVNISSIGGRIAFPFFLSYASTKFALK